MKKLFKKSGALIIALAMMFSGLTFTAYAAEGVIQFSDPSSAAGDVVEVRMKVLSDAGEVGDYSINITYDPTLLRFESGDNVTGGDGELTITSGVGLTEGEILHTMQFTALDEGVSTIDVSGYEASMSYGEELNLALGSGTITVEGGTPVTEEEGEDEEESGSSSAVTDGLTAEVDGITYTINTEFKEKDIPLGCVAKDVEYNGSTTHAMVIEATGDKVFFLTDGEGVSDYFIYDEEAKTFSKTEPILINNKMTLFICNNTENPELPERFQTTTMSINEKEFTIWNNVDNQDYYLVYAVSSEGTKGFYQYDSVEETYQRVNMADIESAPAEETEKAPSAGIMGTIEENLMMVIIVGVAMIILLLIIVIILAVKLAKRDDDMDSDDYDFSFKPAEPVEEKSVKSAKKKSKKKASDDDEIKFDDYDDDQSDFDIEFDDYEDDDDDFFPDEFGEELDEEFEEDFEEDFDAVNKKVLKNSKEDSAVDFIEL